MKQTSLIVVSAAIILNAAILIASKGQNKGAILGLALGILAFGVWYVGHRINR